MDAFRLEVILKTTKPIIYPDWYLDGAYEYFSSKKLKFFTDRDSCGPLDSGDYVIVFKPKSRDDNPFDEDVYNDIRTFYKSYLPRKKDNELIDMSFELKGTPPAERTEQARLKGLTGSYRVTVKNWMLRKATPDFTFMKDVNDDFPMPLRTMVGDILQETQKRYYMQLHGDITSTVTQFCLKCGKEITNDISKYFGMGPVCGHHNYTNPFDSKEELQKAVEDYRVNVLQKMTWEGWIPKSAIITMEEL